MTGAYFQLPLKVVELDEPELEPVYSPEVLLVRSDHHIAWRGSSNLKPDAKAIISHILGR